MRVRASGDANPRVNLACESWRVNLACESWRVNLTCQSWRVNLWCVNTSGNRLNTCEFETSRVNLTEATGRGRHQTLNLYLRVTVRKGRGDSIIEQVFGLAIVAKTQFRPL